MKNQEFILKIPCGYKILKKQRQVDLVEAKRLLDIRNRSYSKIQRKNDLVTVYWHRLVCPHCGKLQNPYVKNKRRINADEILYAPLFERENKTINFENAELFDKEYVCIKCGNVSYSSNQEQEIVIGCNQTSAYVMRKLRDINDYMNLNWIDCVDFATDLCEKIEFNFETGVTTISIQAEQQAVVTKNIIDFDLSSDFSVLAELINKNNVVKRTLKRQFQSFWKEKIPFTQKELSLKEFVMMTQFIDFSKEFYFSIPFLKQTNEIHASFVTIATRLHTAKGAIEWLNKHSFARKKSIKSLFYNKQGLFFYINECEKLYNIFQNVDYFCQVMNSKSCFNILSVINNYSGITRFYEDYCDVVGVKKLVSALLCDLELLNENAVRYFAASSVGKMIERENWKLEKNIEKEVGPLRLSLKTPFSIPMHTIPENINDCIVDRFQFKWLRTKSDYQKAGEELDNCLEFWEYDSNPVVGVYIQGKIVAAIEILGNRIRQARRFNNEIIDERSALFKAIQKWSKIYSLEFKEENFDFE